MNIMENFYIYLYHKQNILVEEQTPTEENPLFRLITPHPAYPHHHADFDSKHSLITQFTFTEHTLRLDPTSHQVRHSIH
jgi:hypothetical protein